MTHRRTVALLGRFVLPPLLLAVLAGCGPKPVNRAIRGERTLVEASGEGLPAWVTREPASDAEYHYFRGVRTDAPTLEAGETDARQDAIRKIVEFLGLRVTVDYQRMRTEEQTRLQDALRSVGGADIFGTRLSELYYRRWRVREGDRLRDVYDVYVIVRFPRESVERIKQNQQERLRNISQLMAGPGFMAQPGEIYGQIAQMAQALAAISELNQSLLITTETEGQADNLKRQANARLSRLIGGLRLSLSTSAPQVMTGHQEPPFAISVNVTAEDRGQPAPAPNVPVNIAFGDSTQAQVVWSDERGVAQWQVLDIPFGEGAQTITARVELPDAVRGVPDFMRSIPTASASVEIVPATHLVKLLVVVEERTNGRPSDRRTGESRLVEALREEGFTVVSPAQVRRDSLEGDPWANESDALAFAAKVGATMLLRGTMETGEATPVEMMPGVFLTTAQVRLALTDIATKHVVATINLPDEVMRDTRGFGNTPERAAESALTLVRRGQPNGYTYLAEQVRNAIRR